MQNRYFYNFDQLPGDAITPFKNGVLSECIEICEDAIEKDVAVPAALYLLGGCAVRAGEINIAANFFEKALHARPEVPNPYFCLSLLNQYHGERSMATMLHRQGLVRINPEILEEANDLFDEAHFLLNQHELEQAAEVFEEGLELTPFLAPHWLRLGDCLHDDKKYEESEAAYKEAILHNPVFVEVYRNLAIVADKLDSMPARSVNILEEALRVWEKFTPARYQLGEILRRKSMSDEAYTHFKYITENDPSYPAAYRRLADCARDLGRIDEAVENYEIYMKKNPAKADSTKMDIAFSIPPILSSKEEAKTRRADEERMLKELSEETLFISDPARDIRGVNFYSAYLGLNERDIQQKTAGIFRRACPPLKYVAPHIDKPRKEGKPRIGIFSCNLKRHSVGRLLYRTIIQLPRDQFDVTIIFGDNHNDEVVELLKSQFPSINVYSPITEGNYEEIQKDISELELDILYYPDIGMDVQTYFMAFCRFAPVQVASWHHPLTTGIDTVDYFLSSKKFETENGQDHFSEKLIEFETTLQNFEKIRNFTPSMTREELGYKDSDTLYGIPQSLFKMHPDFDDMIRGILEKDPNGYVLVLEASRKEWGDTFMERLEKTMPDVKDRVRFIDRTSITGIHNYMNLFDVSLDPPHWGGGVTSLECFSQGCPVITLPSPYTRARLTLGYYLEMGIEDCIASTPEEFVNLAVDIATNKERRKEISDRILEKCDVLYDNPKCAEELAEFFNLAFEKQQNGEKIEKFK